MKKIFQIGFICACILCLSATTYFNADAKNSETQDDVTVTIKTDKTQYTTAEDIPVVVRIQNNTNTAMKNISLETTLPEEFVVKNGKLSESKIAIEAREAYTYKVTAQLNIKKKTPKPQKKKDKTEKTVSKSTKKSQKNAFKSTLMGDHASVLKWLAVFSAGIACSILFIKHKKHRSILGGFLIVTVLVSSITSNLRAEDVAKKTISVDTEIQVDGQKFPLKAKVTYSLETKEADENIKKPETSEEADAYYEENSKVKRIIPVKDSKDVLSEREVKELLEESGLSGYPVTYPYTLDGQYLEDEKEIADSEEKHPMYQTSYVNSSNETWILYIVNGQIYANPLSFNLQTTLSGPLMISETSFVTSYDNEGNNFYEAVPTSNATLVKKVEKIDGETLDNLTVKELNKYEE